MGTQQEQRMAQQAQQLIDAASSGKLVDVQKLLTWGVHVDAENNGRSTPLIKAVSGNHPDIARVLIAKGANVNHTNFYLNTPLIMACYHGHLELAKMLLAAGASPDAKDKDGTALDNARKRNEPACVALLEEWQDLSPEERETKAQNEWEYVFPERPTRAAAETAKPAEVQIAINRG